MAVDAHGRERRYGPGRRLDIVEANDRKVAAGREAALGKAIKHAKGDDIVEAKSRRWRVAGSQDTRQRTPATRAVWRALDNQARIDLETRGFKCSTVAGAALLLHRHSLTTTQKGDPLVPQPKQMLYRAKRAAAVVGHDRDRTGTGRTTHHGHDRQLPRLKLGHDSTVRVNRRTENEANGPIFAHQAEHLDLPERILACVGKERHDPGALQP